MGNAGGNYSPPQGCVFMEMLQSWDGLQASVLCCRYGVYSGSSRQKIFGEKYCWCHDNKGLNSKVVHEIQCCWMQNNAGRQEGDLD